MSTNHDRETKPASWPLLFTHKSTVLGQGYIAKIELTGRLLAELEVDGVWLYGVNPGALAVGASTLAFANVDLYKALNAVFVEFAEQAPTFADFRRLVERFFNECDAESESEWDAALARMKAGATIEAPVGLPVKDGVRTAVYVNVTEQSAAAVTAQDNPAVACAATDSELSTAA